MSPRDSREQGVSMSKIAQVSFAALFFVLVAMMGFRALGQSAQASNPDVKAPARSAGPGPIQQQMAKRAGQWTLAKKLSMPGQAPMEATGSAKIISILGGRFLREENDGMLFGQPVAAEMMSGYNDETNRFEIVWGWTGANRLIWAVGVSTDGGKTVHYTSSYDNGKGKIEQLVIDLRIIDDDHYVINLVSKMPNGDDGPAVETTYTRQK
jgi:hypothetical protein